MEEQEMLWVLFKSLQELVFQVLKLGNTTNHAYENSLL
jgi:hypothetical protein